MTPIHDEEEQRAKNKLRTYLAGLTHPPGLKLTHPPVRTGIAGYFIVLPRSHGMIASSRRRIRPHPVERVVRIVDSYGDMMCHGSKMNGDLMRPSPDPIA